MSASVLSLTESHYTFCVTNNNFLIAKRFINGKLVVNLMHETLMECFILSLIDRI